MAKNKKVIKFIPIRIGMRKKYYLGKWDYTAGKEIQMGAEEVYLIADKLNNEKEKQNEQ